MTRRAALDTAAARYQPGSAGTASDGFRIPQPRTADPTPTPQPAGGASNEKGSKL